MGQSPEKRIGLSVWMLGDLDPHEKVHPQKRGGGGGEWGYAGRLFQVGRLIELIR